MSMAKAHATACTGVQPRDWRGPDKLRVVSLTNDYSRFATFGSTTIEGLIFETVLNFAQIVASIAQCSSEHMACIFPLGLVRFTDLFKVFESYFQFPFQKIAPYLERHLIFFVCHGATVARILQRFRQP
jgi:hypothetical protein